MKTTYLVLLVIIAAGLGVWYSIDALSNTTILIEENGQLFRDNYTTIERFFALWPISIIGGLILAIVISIAVLFAFEASKQSDIKELKVKLENQISHYEQLSNQCLSDVENANKQANEALEKARAQAQLEIEQELNEIEAEKVLISEIRREQSQSLYRMQSRSKEIEETLVKNNELMKNYKREVKIAKQRARNHGSTLSRTRRFIERLKTDPEYLNSFIEENYET